MSKLLKEAIADAKAVRETALANARLALEEAFAPRLQSMLTKKLREEELELDGEESEDEVSDEVGEGSYSEDDEEVDIADEAPEEEPAEEEAPAEDEVGGDEEIADEIEDLEGDEEEAVEEDSFDLDTIIRELEQEIEEGSYSEEDDEVELDEASCSEDDEEEAIEESEESEESEEEEAVEEQSKSSELGKGGDEHVVVADSDDEELPSGTETVAGEPGTEGEEEKVAEIDEEIDIEIVEESEESEEDDEEEAVEESIEESEDEEDEEINLEEILRELEEETNIEEEEESSEISELKGANEKLQKENDEYRKVYKFLRGKLNEVNLLNAKLLYTNKLFKKHALSEDQKLKVVESFDLTKNVREAKLVYATLGESFRTQATEVVEEAKSAPKKKKTEKNPLTEGIASKAIKSTKPSKKILSEGNELAERFKKLAGIKS